MPWVIFIILGAKVVEVLCLLQVLHLEQMLTTGGGWQDQCGGLYGGLKISWSDKKLPVHVQTRLLG